MESLLSPDLVVVVVVVVVVRVRIEDGVSAKERVGVGNILVAQVSVCRFKFWMSDFSELKF